MSRAAIVCVSLVCLVLGACSSDPEGAVDDLDASSMCGYAAGLTNRGADGGTDGGTDAGAGPCHAAQNYVTCASPSGKGCVCVTDDATCDDCALDADATCQSNCDSNEYGLACDPVPTPSGSFTFAPVPAGCRGIDSSFFGNAFYCCPCL